MCARSKSEHGAPNGRRKKNVNKYSNKNNVLQIAINLLAAEAPGKKFLIWFWHASVNQYMLVLVFVCVCVCRSLLQSDFRGTHRFLCMPIFMFGLHRLVAFTGSFFRRYLFRPELLLFWQIAPNAGLAARFSISTVYNV